MRGQREEPKDAARLGTAWRSIENPWSWGAKKCVGTSTLPWGFVPFGSFQGPQWFSKTVTSTDFLV